MLHAVRRLLGTPVRIGVGFFFASFVALAATSTRAQAPERALERLSPEARDWVNRSCAPALGPSLWSSCVIREAAAASRGKPDLSGLRPDLRAWVTSSCSDSLGPSLTISCLAREKAALDGGLPDISFLTEEQRRWVSDSCSTSLGPSLYVSCVRRESTALRGSKSIPQQSRDGAASVISDEERGVRNYLAILAGQRRVEELSPQELREVLAVHRAAERQAGGGGCGGAIESQIDGTFEGWSGDTVFKLTNGQLWQQSSYAYTYHYAYRPKVVIFSGDGGCKMKVDGVSDTVSVRRLR